MIYVPQFMSTTSPSSTPTPLASKHIGFFSVGGASSCMFFRVEAIQVVWEKGRNKTGSDMTVHLATPHPPVRPVHSMRASRQIVLTSSCCWSYSALLTALRRLPGRQGGMRLQASGTPLSLFSFNFLPPFSPF